MSKPDFTYEQALNSFNGVSGDLSTGGRRLLRSILSIGTSQGIRREQIALDIADRLDVAREDVERALANCHLQRQLKPVPILQRVKFTKERKLAK